MKRILALLVACACLAGCTPKVAEQSADATTTLAPTEFQYIQITEEPTPVFSDLSDQALTPYLENAVYTNLVEGLSNENYLVENVSAVYLSKEYLEEIEYNSLENVYFGFTLSELDAAFQGARYVFTLGEDGQTTVTEFQEYDDIYEKVLRNVTIGVGVILICVTVSVVSGGLGGHAVSMIFAASAKSGAIMGLTGGVLGGVASGVVTGIETGSFDEALKAAALAGSEGFKWGVISGVVEGGIAEGIALKGATLNGLTMNEAALIQKESKLPLEFIKNFHSVDEYNALKGAGLKLTKVNGKMALTQDIDWNFADAEGRTNAQRVANGLSPLDSTGKSYELHHIGQKADSPLAILSSSQHKDNYSVLHANTGGSASNIDRTAFNKERIEFWKKYFEMTGGA